jgi:hypothetical protein
MNRHGTGDNSPRFDIARLPVWLTSPSRLTRDAHGILIPAGRKVGSNLELES